MFVTRLDVNVEEDRERGMLRAMCGRRLIGRNRFNVDVGFE